MKPLRHPNFILAVISIIIFFIGIALKANSSTAGDYVIVAAIVLGAIHYIWSIIDVATTPTLQAVQRKFWLIIVIIVPAFGSIIYYLMHTRNKQII